MGNKVDVKVLVGTANVEREASKEDEAWWERTQEASTSCEHSSSPLWTASQKL